ncbi:MAG: hypothetical protein ACJ72E_03000 [Marmoricola sp.]
MIARRQLNELGIDADRVRNQLAARRWVARTSTVVSTFSGELSWSDRVWMAVLHAGGDAMAGGLTALELHGLNSWHRDEVTVLVDDELSLDPVPGVVFFRTRRPLGPMKAPGALPIAGVEVAALLFAAYDRSPRTAQGVLAAVVQQGLSTATRLEAQLATMRPLRRAPLFRGVLSEIAGGADSLAELDIARLCRRAGLARPRRQVRRRDATGRIRFTDCEWTLPSGRTLVLEIDGSFHMDVLSWEDDLARQRDLSADGRTIIRCTARELREEPGSIVAALKRHGLCA